MPAPRAVRQVNKRVTNPVLRRLAGHGWFVELEHVGRRSGRPAGRGCTWGDGW